MSQIKELFADGLWKNNSALVQVLGLCPLLAVSSTVTNALGLGLATTLVLICTNVAVSALRRWIPSEIRIPIYVMLIASVVTAVQLLINAYAFGLYQSLGIFIPLIVTNCIVIGRAEAFAAKNAVYPSAIDGWLWGSVRPPRCLCSVPCVKFSVTALCLTVPICCLVTGPKCCASMCCILTPRSCWLCCHRCLYRAWLNAGRQVSY